MRKPTVSSDQVAGDQLRAFFERIERLDEELKSINGDKKEVFAEAKGNGFDTKVMKIILKERRQDANERLEMEALVELYRAALGMAAYPRDEGGDEDEPETGTQYANARAPARPNSAATGERHSQPQITATEVAADPEGGDSPAPSSDPNSNSQHDAGDQADSGPQAAEGLSNSPVLVEGSRSTRGTDVGEDGGAESEPTGLTASDPQRSVGPTREDGPAEGSDTIPRAPTAAENALSLRPYCLHAHDLHNCAGQGRKHCHSCLKAQADAEGIAA